jgi:hypothetical protein
MGEPEGTHKWIFNALYLGTGRQVRSVAFIGFMVLVSPLRFQQWKTRPLTFFCYSPKLGLCLASRKLPEDCNHQLFLEQCDPTRLTIFLFLFFFLFFCLFRKLMMSIVIDTFLLCLICRCLRLLGRYRPAGYPLCHNDQHVDVVRTTKLIFAQNPILTFCSSTHLSSKNLYRRGDDWLIVNRWEQLMEMRDNLTFVELVTWCEA